MKKIAITLPDFIPCEAQAIVRALRSGYDRIHLRKPGSTIQDMAALIMKIPTGYRQFISLHDHLGLAVEHGLGGVHLNARFPEKPSGFNGLVSRSCHSIDEVAACKEACDYVFLSPVFDSISKEGYCSGFTSAQIRQARDCGIIDSKVYALGGITPEKADILEEMGFGGGAMLGYVWKSFRTPPVVLSIAGSDSSGGAGIQADIKAISAAGCYAASAITALTAQNTTGVRLIRPAGLEMIVSQIDAIFDDMDVAAVKIGMIYDSETAVAVAQRLKAWKAGTIVCDPVMISTSGSVLMKEETVQVVEKELFPLSTVITPNLHEASMLYGGRISSVEDMKTAAASLSDRYGCAVLIKGGHLDGSTICDILYDGETYVFASERIESSNLHGTGCTLSSAIASQLALGKELHDAVKAAKEYVTSAIREAAQMNFGKGSGPLWHFPCTSYFTDDSACIADKIRR